MADQHSQIDDPTDLGSLVAGLDRIAAEYDARVIGTDLAPEMRLMRQELSRIRAILLNSMADVQTVDDIRRLLATGALAYQIPNLSTMTEVHALYIQQFACTILWPLVVTGPFQLSVYWGRAASTIMTEELVNLISRTRQEYHRYDIRRNPVEIAQHLTQALGEPQYAEGIRNLLEDLRDPKKGGAALIALATVRDAATPSPWPNVPSMLKWLLFGAASGIIGNRADALVVSVWRQLFPQAIDNPPLSETNVVRDEKQLTKPDSDPHLTTQSDPPRPLEPWPIKIDWSQPDPHPPKRLKPRSRPHGLFRRSKVYICRVDAGPTSTYSYYHRILRFYENRTVIYINLVSDSIVSEWSDIDTWFNDEIHDDKGKFTIKGRNITFSTKSEEGVKEFVGKILRGKLILDICSHVDGVDERESEVVFLRLYGI